MAAKLWLKLFEPRFSNVWTKTSIFNEKASSFSAGPGRVFSKVRTSSEVHFLLIDTTSSWAVAVPGRAPTNRIHKFSSKFNNFQTNKHGTKICFNFLTCTLCCVFVNRLRKSWEKFGKTLWHHVSDSLVIWQSKKFNKIKKSKIFLVCLSVFWIFDLFSTSKLSAGPPWWTSV